MSNTNQCVRCTADLTSEDGLLWAIYESDLTKGPKCASCNAVETPKEKAEAITVNGVPLAKYLKNFKHLSR